MKYILICVLLVQVSAKSTGKSSSNTLLSPSQTDEICSKGQVNTLCSKVGPADKTCQAFAKSVQGTDAKCSHQSVCSFKVGPKSSSKHRRSLEPILAIPSPNGNGYAAPLPAIPSPNNNNYAAPLPAIPSPNGNGYATPLPAIPSPNGNGYGGNPEIKINRGKVYITNNKNVNFEKKPGVYRMCRSNLVIVNPEKNRPKPTNKPSYIPTTGNPNSLYKPPTPKQADPNTGYATTSRTPKDQKKPTPQSPPNSNYKNPQPSVPKNTGPYPQFGPTPKPILSPNGDYKPTPKPPGTPYDSTPNPTKYNQPKPSYNPPNLPQVPSITLPPLGDYAAPTLGYKGFQDTQYALPSTPKVPFIPKNSIPSYNNQYQSTPSYKAQYSQPPATNKPYSPQGPSIPNLPTIPKIPSIPNVPTIPKIPSTPQIPSIPSLPMYSPPSNPSYNNPAPRGNYATTPRVAYSPNSDSPKSPGNYNGPSKGDQGLTKYKDFAENILPFNEREGSNSKDNKDSRDYDNSEDNY